MQKQAYHHGDLASALIKATVFLLATKGAATLSLREIARVAGVSHGAPAHHFGDKSGLLTAVATKGQKLLGDALLESQVNVSSARMRLNMAGQVYVRFAIEQPAFFSIMFETELINPRDKDYIASRVIAKSVLEKCIRDVAGKKKLSDRQLNSSLARLWSLVHGFSVLWLSGNFGDPDDLELLDSILSDMLTRRDLK
jgi:AcrR family transcriptional regulator